MIRLSGDGAPDTGADPVRSAYPEMEEWLNDPGTVLHWYDFLCPFCYVAQSRNEMLRHRGFLVVELPFEVHPEIPRGGAEAGPRNGLVYKNLEREARQAGLVLHWPARLPNTR